MAETRFASKSARHHKEQAAASACRNLPLRAPAASPDRRSLLGYLAHLAFHDVPNNTAEPMKAGVAFALRVPNHRNCEWCNVHRHGTGCQAKHFGPLLCRLLGYGRDNGSASENQWQRGEPRRRIDDFAPFAA